MQGFFFRNPEHGSKGLVWLAGPGNTSLKYLRYGRVLLGDGEKVCIDTGSEEYAVVVLSGKAVVETEGGEFEAVKHSAVYIPKDSSFRIQGCGGGLDAAVFAAEAVRKYSPFFADIREILGRPEKHKVVGGENSKREVITLIGQDVEADRLLVGVTWTMKGNWSSWPPHEHGDLLEEIYVFYDMDRRAFGIQMVYEDFEEPMFIGLVRNGDCVVIPRGFHPNVAAPGFELKYVWAMCALEPVKYRVYGKMRVQEGYG